MRLIISTWSFARQVALDHRIEYAAKAPADDPAIDEKRCDAVTFATMHLPRKDPMVALIGSSKGRHEPQGRARSARQFVNCLTGVRLR